jgi:hypothetical protein
LGAVPFNTVASIVIDAADPGRRTRKVIDSVFDPVDKPRCETFAMVVMCDIHSGGERNKVTLAVGRVSGRVPRVGTVVAWPHDLIQGEFAFPVIPKREGYVIRIVARQDFEEMALHAEQQVPSGFVEVG